MPGSCRDERSRTINCRSTPAPRSDPTPTCPFLMTSPIASSTIRGSRASRGPAASLQAGASPCVRAAARRSRIWHRSFKKFSRSPTEQCGSVERDQNFPMITVPIWVVYGAPFLLIATVRERLKKPQKSAINWTGLVAGVRQQSPLFARFWGPARGPFKRP